MKIIGIGTDIVSLARIRTIWDRFGDTFARRILMPVELAEFKVTTEKVAFLGKRFAAKEAFAKASGFGFRANSISLRDIGIEHDTVGKPHMAFSVRASIFIKELGILESQVTLADERDYAIAFVLLIGS